MQAEFSFYQGEGQKEEGHVRGIIDRIPSLISSENGRDMFTDIDFGEYGDEMRDPLMAYKIFEFPGSGILAYDYNGYPDSYDLRIILARFDDSNPRYLRLKKAITEWQPDQTNEK